MTANCTETSGYEAGRFSFSGPARATAAPASGPGVSTVPIVSIISIVPIVSTVSTVPGVPTVPIVSSVSSVSGRTERTERTERRDMPRIGPFVLARPIDGSSFFL